MKLESSSRSGRATVSAFLAFAALLFVNTSARGQVIKRERSLQVDDIPNRVQIIGRLGHPLGELMSITGEWFVPQGEGGAAPKDVAHHFRVLTVDGGRLDAPVEFDRNLVTPIYALDKELKEPQEGVMLEMRAVETGSLRGFTEMVLRERWRLNNDGEFPVDERYRFRFVSELRYIPGSIYKSDPVFGKQPLQPPAPKVHGKYERFKKLGRIKVEGKIVEGKDVEETEFIIMLINGVPTTIKWENANIDPKRRYLTVKVVPKGIKVWNAVLRFENDKMNGTLVTVRTSSSDFLESQGYSDFKESTAIYDVTNLLPAERLGNVPFDVHKMFLH